MVETRATIRIKRTQNNREEVEEEDESDDQKVIMKCARAFDSIVVWEHDAWPTCADNPYMRSLEWLKVASLFHHHHHHQEHNETI